MLLYLFFENRDIIIMSSYTLQAVTNSYQLLSHSNAQTRQSANLFLMGLIYQDSAWKITQEMITTCNNQNYQFLGAQILHQKIQKEILSLQKPELHFLKQFLFSQLALPTYNLPTIRKITSAAALIAVVSCLEDWPHMVNDIVQFMKGPANQLQNGLILLSNIAEELNKSNVIRQGLKMQVKQKMLEQQQLLSEVFLSTLTISSQITTFSLQAVENWTTIGFPLMKYKAIINVLIMLIEQQQDLFFQTCCKIISQSIKIISQLKFQTLATVDLAQEVQKYTADQIESLKLIIVYLRNTKTQLFAAIKSAQGIENIEIYTLIVKEMLLSFGFLLLEDVGFQLIQIMVNAVQSKNLKLSFSTFQFWLDFCQKWSKHKISQNLENKIWSIIQYLFSVILQKVKLQSSSLNQLKQQDTIDDLQDLSFTEYRKQSRYIIKAAYEYFTKKKLKQGSNAFFNKLISKIQQDSTVLGVYTELAIFAVKSSIQSMIQQYDTHNLTAFVQYLILKTQNIQVLPIKLTAQLLSIITDCNRQIKSKDALFLKCLAFSLKYVDDEELCHYSVYAFQSLMESIQAICSAGLISDLLIFYESKHFTKQIVLQKILDGILTSITKLQDRNLIIQYFTRIMNAISINNNKILSHPFAPQTSFLPLIQIKTVLDCFDNFQPNDKQYFRTIFLNISNQGIAMVTRIISNYLVNRLKFSNVNQLGVSLAVCKNSLKICENVAVQYLPINTYIGLMNIILSILNPNDMNYYSTYSSLIDIINKILTQFMNIKVPALDAWLAVNLLPINQFYLSYSKQKSKFTQNDSDIIKDLFVIQESVLIYSQQIFLSQPQTQQIFNLALLSLQYLNQKQMQRRVANFIYLCVQIPVFKCKYDVIVRSVFYSIPIVNSICYINIGRILIMTLEGVDVKKKEQVFRELLEYQPYHDVDRDLKEILAKFLAFTIETKLDRYIRGVLNDITDAKWKKSGNDLALHLQMRFSSWKREYNKMLKSGQVPK